MKLHVLMSDDRVAELHRAVARLHLIQAHTATSFIRAVELSVDGVAVVDLTLVRDDVADRIVAAVHAAGAPLVCASPHSPLAFSRFLKVAAAVPASFFLIGETQPVAALVKIIDEAAETPVAKHVLTGLTSRLANLPREVAYPVASLFCSGVALVTAHELAHSFGTGESHVRDALATTGLAGMPTLRRCARVAHAYRDLRDSSETLA